MERRHHTSPPASLHVLRVRASRSDFRDAFKEAGRRLFVCLLGLTALIPYAHAGAPSEQPPGKEQHERFDPDALIDFDIPRARLSDAIDRFTQTLNSASPLSVKNRGANQADRPNIENIWVGPVRGRMSARKAFARLTEEVCVTSLYEEHPVTLSYEGKPVEFQYSTLVSREAKQVDIPRMSRESALEELVHLFESSELNIYYSSHNTNGQDQELVGPINGVMRAADAVNIILSGSNLVFGWVNAPTPTISIQPARDGFVYSGCNETILVTQDRLKVLDFGSVLRVSRRDIEKSRASSVPELLTQLSQAGVTLSIGSNATGAQYADFRGLGPDTWLILINGRRAMPSANNVNTPSFDLNTIPLTAIERIDIQLDSGSTRNGADAIAGVIDIVTLREIERPSIEVRYSAASDGAVERRGTVSVGTADGTPWRAAAVLDTFEMGGLLALDREITANQDYRRYGGLDYRRSFGARTLDGNALPGLDLSFAALPSTPDPVSLFSYRSLVPAGRRDSFIGMTEYVGKRATGTAELIWVRRNNQFSYFPATASGIVPADNPTNPYGVPVIVDALLTGLPSMEQIIDSELKRAVLGVRAELGEWSLAASALFSDEDSEAWLANGVDASAVSRALAASEPGERLDAFSERPGSTLPPGVMAQTDVTESVSRGDQLLLTSEGPALELPGGAARLRLGFEYRHEQIRFNEAVEDTGRSIRSSHAELALPLFRRLRTTAGIRHDSYSDSPSATNPQYSLSWSNPRGFTLGATTAKSYRPPSLYELRLPVEAFPTVVLDRRQGKAVEINFLTGGNANLQPSTGESRTFFASYTTAGGARAQLRHFSLEVSDRIAVLPLETALQFEESLPDRVRRAEPTTQELEAGMPGRLLSIDTSRLNYGRLQTSGVDLELLKTFQSSLGSFASKLAATWVDDFELSDAPVAGYPLTDRVGIADTRGSIIRWRAIGSLDWEYGPWRTGTQLRFVPAYHDTAATREIGSQMIWDANLSYSLGTSATVTFGVRDLLDTQAQFAHEGAALGFDWTQWDPVGRRASLAIKTSF